MPNRAEELGFKPDDKWLPNKSDWWWKMCYITDAAVTKTPILFISIPKNASASIKTVWKLPQAEKDVNLMHLRVAYPEIPHHDYPKLVVIRNPLYRAISGFFFLSHLPEHTNHIETVQTKWYRTLGSKEITSKNIKKAFSLFLDYVADRLYDHHIYPQYLYLERKGLQLSDIDYVLLQEKLDKGFGELCKILGLDHSLGKMNTVTKPMAAAVPRPVYEKTIVANIRNHLQRRNVPFLDKICAMYSLAHANYANWRGVTQLADRNSQYAFLHDVVESDQGIRRKIERVYAQDFDVYEEARSRAL